ncbi:hypothetical protein WS67_19110 [Burkholderia singularis]|uniref:Uncharacterized protein n=1 Tax=Burkholderia singularis TaxID=1503053 RepID=A0A103DZ47_9BURK|nr:hypothetical protein WS67_19110 [Burkholderia singularis]
MEHAQKHTVPRPSRAKIRGKPKACAIRKNRMGQWQAVIGQHGALAIRVRALHANPNPGLEFRGFAL